MILLCVATDVEGALLRERLANRSTAAVIVTGVGPVNAAHAATVAILESRPSAIVCCGIGGAYPSSGLQVGDVVSAETEVYGDLGAQSAEGFLDMRSLGFPVIKGEVPLFNLLPMQIFPTHRRARFVTVSTCTGSDATAQEIERRTGGGVESMEGAAIAHVAHLHGIPVGEVRGISNIVTNRDKGAWKIREAAEAAQHTIVEWLKTSGPQTSRP
jgi:futalosine hydrolase